MKANVLEKIIREGDVDGLRVQLAARPELANIALPQGKDSPYRVHPIHLICDGVFEKHFREEQALEMTRVLIAAGSDVNGKQSTTTSVDTPLITAASLYCESIAVYLLDQGADPSPRGTHQGTALHWAGWTGSAKVVQRLLEEGVALDDQGDELHATPLLWAINGLLHQNPANHRQQPEAIALLLKAGADPNLKDSSGRQALDILLDNGKSELAALVEANGGRKS